MESIFRRSLATAAVSILLCFDAAAQFSTTGSDPASVKWSSMDTPDFRLIYPAGSDSLARVYGIRLEAARADVARSSGYLIGQNYRSRMPVILHGHYVLPNASVVWAPKRMDIFTVRDPYSPTPMPWEKHLAIHEGRHAAQMQFGADGKLKVMHWLTGEMFAGAMAGLFPGPALLEGDAVVAETALSRTGRGRQAYFLEYMMPAFDCGDWRDWYRWIYGSNRLYTPDHYRSGYMMVAGARVFFNEPLFIRNYFSAASRKLRLFNLRKTLKEASGMNLKKSYRTIEEGFHGIWDGNTAARGPFMPSSQVTGKPWRHTEYAGGAFVAGAGIYSLKSGMVTSGSLVRLTTGGKETRLRPFASYTSGLVPDPSGERIYWSESVSGRRWTLGGDSRIRYIETSSPGAARDLTRKGKFFNPAPSPDSKVLAVTEYPVKGGSRICLLDTSDGSVSEIYAAPDSLQFTEPVWIGERLFTAGLSENGMGIYEIAGTGTDGKALLRPLTGTAPVTLSHLRPMEFNGTESLSFLCDRTGVTELYSLDIDVKTLRQVTSTRYGIGDPFLNGSADTLYYSSLAPSDKPEAYRQGRMLYATAVKDLPMAEVRFEDIYEYPVAEALSDQEEVLASLTGSASAADTSIFSRPRRYSKTRFQHIHSWAPIYFNYDNVESISGDEYYKTASPGATVLFQNLLSTGYGFIGYSAHEDPYNDGGWRHSGHLKYIYSGLYPVLEFSADLNDRAAMDIQKIQQTKGNTFRLFNKGTLSDKPYFSGSVKAYIPFNFSSGGLRRGLIPQVSYKYTNDRYNDQILLQKIVTEDGRQTAETIEILNESHLAPLQTLDFSLRGYLLRQTADAQVFPSLGIGAELGVHTRPGHSDAYSSTAYVYTYGYLSGINAQQGLKLTASIEFDLGTGGRYSTPEGALNAIPRGFVDTNLRSVLNSCSNSRFRLTADYAIPFLFVDWSFLSPAAYIKNFEVMPFFDWSALSFKQNSKVYYNPRKVISENLFSVGADLTVKLGNFLWLPYDTAVGIRYARNFWSGIDSFAISGLNSDYIGILFNISM